jgi:hypothetical protein
MKRIILGLFLGLFAVSAFGCARPEPKAQPMTEEVIGTSDRTEKTEWEPVMPGK